MGDCDLKAHFFKYFLVLRGDLPLLRRTNLRYFRKPLFPQISYTKASVSVCQLWEPPSGAPRQKENLPCFVFSYFPFFSLSFSLFFLLAILNCDFGWMRDITSVTACPTNKFKQLHLDFHRFVHQNFQSFRRDNQNSIWVACLVIASSKSFCCMANHEFAKSSVAKLAVCHFERIERHFLWVENTARTRTLWNRPSFRENAKFTLLIFLGFFQLSSIFPRVFSKIFLGLMFELCSVCLVLLKNLETDFQLPQRLQLLGFAIRC